MKVSVRPRLKLRSVAAGIMAPELVCWPISSKKTCRREPSTVSLKQQACPAGQLCCCPVSLQRRCSQHGQYSCLGACKRSRMGPFPLGKAHAGPACPTVCLVIGPGNAWPPLPGDFVRCETNHLIIGSMGRTPQAGQKRSANWAYTQKPCCTHKSRQK